MLESDKPQMICCDMAYAHCVLDNEDYRHTHSISILTTFPQQQWLRERACVLRFTCIAYIVTTGLWRFRRRWNDNKLHILREKWSVLRLVVIVVSIDIGAFETPEPITERHIVKSQMS